MQIKRQSRSHFKQITTIIWYGDSLRRIWKHEDNYLYVLLEFHLKLIISLTFRGIAFVIFVLHVLLRLNEDGRIQRKIRSKSRPEASRQEAWSFNRKYPPFCQTTADLLIEHRKLTLPLRPWKIVTPGFRSCHSANIISRKTVEGSQFQNWYSPVLLVPTKELTYLPGLFLNWIHSRLREEDSKTLVNCPIVIGRLQEPIKFDGLLATGLWLILGRTVTLIYLSNRPHFLWVYRRDNPLWMLGEHSKSFLSVLPTFQVSYEFTGRISHRFKTNQNARTILVIL